MPMAHDTGLPPKLEKNSMPLSNDFAICLVVTTAAMGSVSRDACICVEGTYKSGSGVCEQCPEDAECPRGTTVATMKLRSNRWRLSQDTVDIHACAIQTSWNPQTPCRGGRVDYCYEGLRGPLCRVCVQPDSYFDMRTARCASCPAVGFAALMLWIGLVLLVVI